MSLCRHALLCLAALVLPAAGWAQPYAPVVNAADLMNLRYYPANGGFLLESVDLVFPPSGEATAELRVTEGGQPVAAVPLRLTPVDRFSAFASLRPNGAPGGVTLGRPGAYVVSLVVNGAEVGRLPWTLHQVSNDDPFDPQTSFHRDGPWPVLGYLAAPSDDPDDQLGFHYWTSAREAGGSERAYLTLRLTRGGEEVARAKRSVVSTFGSTVTEDTWQAVRDHALWMPDERTVFTLADLMSRDGAYTLTVLADGSPVKTFPLRVEGGAVVPHPRSAPSASPNPDFLTPKMVMGDRSNVRHYLADVFWLEAE